tara:strand:+ start:1279 stop:3027 length:1749 start_codon:yes stop_codon:yes gene_type:complete
MYELIYNNSFFANFITSLIFLILISIFCFSKFYIKNRQIIIFGNFQPIIIFFLIFCIIVFLFNLIIYFNFYQYFKYILYFLSICFFLIWLFFSKKKSILLIKKEIFDLKKEYIILIFFLIFFLISILPISDADSIAIHQYLSNYIYLSGLEDVNLKKNFEFTTLANSEILLILSPILKSDNFGSQLNFFSIFLFYLIFSKSNKSFIFFIFSCPLIIFLISTQKLQLFFSILYLILFILVHQNLLKKKGEIFLFILLLSFYASAKISYVLIAIPLFFYFLILNKKNIYIIFVYSLIVFIIFFIPIFLIKLKFFGNPVSPFFTNFFDKNNEFIQYFALSLRSTEGWLITSSDLKIFLKPFIPTSMSKLSSSLGLLFLFQLFNFSLLKKTKFIPIIIIFLILITGQLLPRYYFEAFLILSFFYTVKQNKLVNLTKFLQSSAVMILSVSFLFIAYFKTNVVFAKKDFMNDFSYSFFNSSQYDDLNLVENILVFPQDRQSIFFKDNIYASRAINVKSLNSDRKQAILSFLKENSISYIIGNDDNFPNCIVLNKIDDIYQKRSIRNFFLNERRKSYNVYLINANNCKL